MACETNKYLLFIIIIISFTRGAMVRKPGVKEA